MRSRIASPPRLLDAARSELSDAARGYEIFNNKEDHCEKVVLHA